MTATAKPDPENWRDPIWLPADVAESLSVITRDEVIARVEKFSGEKITPRDLTYWVGQHVIPASVRRWHQGGMRGIYPTSIVRPLIKLREWQSLGYELDEIKPLFREAFLKDSIERSSLDVEETIERVLAVDRRGYSPDLPSSVRDELANIGWIRGKITGTPTVKIEVVITGADGRKSRYQVEPLANGNQESP